MIRQRHKFLKALSFKMEDERKDRKNIAFTVMLPSKGRKRRVRKKSFTEALKEKYCMSDPNKIYTSGFVIDIVVTGKPKSNGSNAELAYLRNVILNNSAVGHASEGLFTLCPNVVDLDLSSNALTEWQDVIVILSQLPHLKFVNLADNKLHNLEKALQSETWNRKLPEIENLVLNRTSTSWADALQLAKKIPALKELHVCQNGYENLNFPEKLHKCLQNINCLRLNNNNLKRWEEIWRLKNLPNLESLILSGNPIRYVFYDTSLDNESDCSCFTADNDDSCCDPSVEVQHIVEDIVCDVFRLISTIDCDSTKPEKVQGCICSENNFFSKLKLLCLSETNLGSWEHFDALQNYPSLDSLRVKDVPLVQHLNQEDRRKLHIASLPNIKFLNGSEVTNTERDKAERHFVRYFMDRANKPRRFHELEAKHGKIERLVDIDIGGGYQEWITVTLICNDTRIPERIHVVDPIGKLRLLVAERFCLYASLKVFKLYHYACGPHHSEEDKTFEELIRRTESLPMSRFDIMDGDEIYVDSSNDNFTNPDGYLKYLLILSYL